MAMTFSIQMGRKYPKITIDMEKCTIPFMCKKCLQICPMAVFNVQRVMSREKRLEETDPRIDGNYLLRVSRRDKCTMCNLCVEACPIHAIKIEMPQKETVPPAAKGEQWKKEEKK
jgi:formate hydrogenlyase subunit 6/NADH:ubiquinone oxidoreductase subunit I